MKNDFTVIQKSAKNVQVHAIKTISFVKMTRNRVVRLRMSLSQLPRPTDFITVIQKSAKNAYCTLQLHAKKIISFVKMTRNRVVRLIISA